jgi:hypothetical protein
VRNCLASCVILLHRLPQTLALMETKVPSGSSVGKVLNLAQSTRCRNSRHFDHMNFVICRYLMHERELSRTIDTSKSNTNDIAPWISLQCIMSQRSESKMHKFIPIVQAEHPSLLLPWAKFQAVEHYEMSGVLIVTYARYYSQVLTWLKDFPQYRAMSRILKSRDLFQVVIDSIWHQVT